ncbi:MAG TPA: 16S rRNA (cytosine(967)-C(5))-methyltransferase RsmB [bacterium]|nr:16S rRNA (cytosine(967)-C(5))-methyltransferase RsmB [bacterium]
MMNNPRALAMQVLRRVLVDNAYSDLALDAALNQSSLADNDRRLVAELVYGVLRHLTYLDWRLGQVSHRPLEKMEHRVADALRIGAYQLLFLDRIPPHAAVDEAVKLVPKRASGLVNAVLRHLPRGEKSEHVPQLRDPYQAASIRWSHPMWLVCALAQQFGDEQMAALLAANQERPPLVLRVNEAKTDTTALLQELIQWHPRAARYAPAGIAVDHLTQLDQLPAFCAGLFLVQSEAAQIVAELLGAHPGEVILDVCAAPGGKTSYFAQMVAPVGQVYAVDIHPRRLRLLSQNLKRLGINNVSLIQADASKDFVIKDDLRFDRVLVDAPCSALGTLQKNPEIRWRLRPDDPARLAQVQAAILAQAARHVRPGGVLMYAVCTYTEDETDRVVEGFLATQPEFALSDLREGLPPRYDIFMQDRGTLLSLPHRTGTEGFFAARFVRKENP